MADIEVENILREIRERVYAEQEVATRSTHDIGDASSSTDSRLETIDFLPRLQAYLDTTARAWDRLPPLLSNRSGPPARVELWLKRHLKRATRWYAWEQINFNAAVHHALTDMAQVLSANQDTIQNLRAQLRADGETRQAEVETLKAQVDGLRRLIADQHQKIETESAAISRALAAHDERLAAVVNELRESVAALRESVAGVKDEGRVCFKQLALESSEAAVLEDRARRKTEVLLEQLERRIDQLETRES